MASRNRRRAASKLPSCSHAAPSRRSSFAWARAAGVAFFLGFGEVGAEVGVEADVEVGRGRGRGRGRLPGDPHEGEAAVLAERGPAALRRHVHGAREPLARREEDGARPLLLRLAALAAEADAHLAGERVVEQRRADDLVALLEAADVRGRDEHASEGRAVAADANAPERRLVLALDPRCLRAGGGGPGEEEDEQPEDAHRSIVTLDGRRLRLTGPVRSSRIQIIKDRVFSRA